MTFQDAIDLAKDRIKRFEKIEGKPWGVEGSMIELSKQVGDLSAQIMVFEKYYYSNRTQENKRYEVTKERIGDELADILYAVIRIADHYDIDLIDAHIKARDDEDRTLKERGM